MLRETHTQIKKMNPKGSSVNSHANLTQKMSVNQNYEDELIKRKRQKLLYSLMNAPSVKGNNNV